MIPHVMQSPVTLFGKGGTRVSDAISVDIKKRREWIPTF